MVPGLRFRKSVKGHGAFSVVYRVKGQAKQDRRTIGPFPRVSIAQAREEAREDLNAASSGRDPKVLRTARSAEVPEAQVMTFTELFETYLERHARENIATWDDVQRKIRKDAMPIIGEMPAGEVRKRHLHLVIDRLVTGGHAPSARGLLHVISGVYTWAEGRELVEYNPVRRFPYPKLTQPPQRRSLTDDQLRTLWFALLRIADNPELEGRRKGQGAGRPGISSPCSCCRGFCWASARRRRSACATRISRRSGGIFQGISAGSGIRRRDGNIGCRWCLCGASMCCRGLRS